MHLITMAHMGEAQGVIEQYNLKRTGPQTFEGEQILCLITGEGPFEAATATSRLLGARNITKVINLGIAGSLNEKFSIGSIYQIRSIYLAIEGRPQFKSFISNDSGPDCVTSFERILNPEKAISLSGVAHVVDREAWGVAMAAKEAHVPFECYKLISDKAGTLGACELVKSEAEKWAAMLAEKLKEILPRQTDLKKDIELEGFYFTFSTKVQFEQLLKKIANREEISIPEVIEQLSLDEFRELKLLPKERARLLLKKMEEKLDPLKKALDDKLNDWKKNFEARGIHLVSDQTWESPEVKVSFQVKSDFELNEKIAELKSLSIETFQKLRNGNVHVE